MWCFSVVVGGVCCFWVVGCFGGWVWLVCWVLLMFWFWLLASDWRVLLLHVVTFAVGHLWFVGVWCAGLVGTSCFWVLGGLI